MKTVSIMEVQYNFSKVIRGLNTEGKLGVTRHKRVVAELVLPGKVSAPEFPDFTARAAETWGGTWQGLSTDALLDESRGER